MATVAVTKIKYNGKVYEAGEKVSKADFDKEVWASLVDNGAVGPEAPAPLALEEEEEVTPVVEEVTKDAAKK